MMTNDPNSENASRTVRQANESKGLVKYFEGAIMHNAPRSPALLVDAKEAARLLSVSPRKLWGMTFEDKPGLPYIRCGRLVRYSLVDLERWIESQRKGGKDAVS